MGLRGRRDLPARGRGSPAEPLGGARPTDSAPPSLSFGSVSGLSSTAGEVAIAAAAAAIVALLACAALAWRLRALRADQRAVLGDRDTDLVSHAASLQREFEALHDFVEHSGQVIGQRLEDIEQRLGHTVTYLSLVRYDAYGEMSGRQSTSIALLDARRSGLVLSSIHHRDQARLYAKQVHEGRGELELSPEEDEAIRLALSQAEARGGSSPQPGR